MKKREIWILAKTVIKCLVLAFVWSNLVITAIFTARLEEILFIILSSFGFSVYLVFGIINDYLPLKRENYERE
jgi:hypothetical protein